MEQIKRIDNTTIEIDGVLYKAEETTKQGNLDKVERLVLAYVENKGFSHYIGATGNISMTFQEVTFNHSTEKHTKARRLKMLWEMLAKVLNEGELDWSDEHEKKEYISTSHGGITICVSFEVKMEGTTYFKQGVIDKAISLFGEENLLFMIKNS